jgi:hypothetical protein
MNNIKVTKTEALILDAVKAVKNKGVSIKEGGWFVEWNSDTERWEPEANWKGHCSCPLGAYLLATQPQPTYDQAQALEDGAETDILCEIAGTALGKDKAWAENFIGNFDDDYDYGDDTDNEPKGGGSRSGRKLRKLLIK